MENSIRTFMYKAGDATAAKIIKNIVSEGWKISCVTSAGSVLITSFQKNVSTLGTKILHA